MAPVWSREIARTFFLRPSTRCAAAPADRDSTTSLTDHGHLAVSPIVAWERLTMRVRIEHDRNAALADLLDRALNKGVVLWGEATISLAGVDLVYVGLKVLVSSVETAQRMRSVHASDVALLGRRGA